MVVPRWKNRGEAERRPINIILTILSGNYFDEWGWMCSGTKTISLHHNMEIYRRNNKDVVYLFCSLNFSAILRKKKHLDIFSIYSIRKSILCQSLSVRFFLMVKAWKKSVVREYRPKKTRQFFVKCLTNTEKEHTMNSKCII